MAVLHSDTPRPDRPFRQLAVSIITPESQVLTSQAAKCQLVPSLVTVSIPVALLQYTGKESQLRIDAYTVEEALGKLNARFPGLSSFIVNEGGHLRRYVNIFVNEQDIRSGDGLKTKLKEGDRLSIVPVVAGG